jgi:hypothetical protein
MNYGHNDKNDKEVHFDFSSRIDFELKRAERYRIFLSLVVFNLGPVLENIVDNGHEAAKKKEEFLSAMRDNIRHSVREIDAISNSGMSRVALLFPETPRQGAEAAARRISSMLNSYCSDYLKKPVDLLLPVEISSFPDAAGARSITSYLEEFSGN